MPGPSRPDGVATRVSWPPSLSARSLIFPRVVSIPPICAASACAASLPEYMSRPCSRSLIEYQPFSPTPTLVPSELASSCGACHDLVDRQLLMRLHGDQHLDDAGGPVTAVRVPRGDDVAGVQVGDQPRFGRDVLGQRRRAGRGDHATARERVTAHRLGGHRQRTGADLAGFGHLGGIDGRRRRLLVRACAGIRRRVRLGGRPPREKPTETSCYQGRSALGRGSYVRHGERRLGDCGRVSAEARCDWCD